MYELFKWASPQQGRGTRRGGDRFSTVDLWPADDGNFLQNQNNGAGTSTAVSPVELQMNLRNVFTITYKAPAMVLSMLKASTITTLRIY